MYLNADLPKPVEVLVRREFLYDFQKGHGEFVPAWAFGVVAKQGCCLGFYVLLETGACWADMPIHALVFDKEAPARRLSDIQPWDCASYDLTVIEFSYLKGAPVMVLLPDATLVRGHYICTVDYAGAGFAETDEHKCTHLIRTEDGLLVGQPNNRCLFGDASFTNPGAGRPDYTSTAMARRWSAEADFSYLEQPRRVLHPEKG